MPSCGEVTDCFETFLTKIKRPTSLLWRLWDDKYNNSRHLTRIKKKTLKKAKDTRREI